MSEYEKGERSNKPVETLRDGPLKVSIFRNQTEKGDYYALDPGRIYTDEKSGEVREASSLSGSEPLRMAHLLTKGYERIGEYKQKEKALQDRPSGRKRNVDERER